MSGYGQYCPVAKAAEIVGERWNLLIIREVLLGAQRFSELQRGLPGISKSLLAQRLRDLEHAGILKARRDADGRGASYVTTPAGAALEPAIDLLGTWAAEWHFGDPKRAELDPSLLMWFARRFVRASELPRERTVVRFDFRGPRAGARWLLIDHGEVTACLEDPGGETSAVVSGDTSALHRVFAGRLSLAAALRDGTVAIDGKPEVTRGFARWFGLSPFASTVSAAPA